MGGVEVMERGSGQYGEVMESGSTCIGIPWNKKIKILPGVANRNTEKNKSAGI